MPHHKKDPWGRPTRKHPGALGGRARSARPRTVYPKPRGASRRHAGIPCRIHTPAGERTIGRVVDGPAGLELVRHVRGSRHLFRAADAWGLDLAKAEALLADGVKSVRVVDVETRVTYSVPLDYLLEHGLRLDLGHGPQVFLRRSRWSQSGAGQLELPMD